MNVEETCKKLKETYNAHVLNDSKPLVHAVYYTESKKALQENNLSKGGNKPLMKLINNSMVDNKPKPKFIQGPLTLSMHTSKERGMTVYIFGEAHAAHDNCVDKLHNDERCPKNYVMDSKIDKCVLKTSERAKQILHNAQYNAMPICEFLQKLFLNTDVFIDFFVEVPPFKGVEYTANVNPWHGWPGHLPKILDTFLPCIQTSKRELTEKCNLMRVHYVDIRRQKIKTDILSTIMETLTENKYKPEKLDSFLEKPEVKKAIKILSKSVVEPVEYKKLLKSQIYDNPHVIKQIRKSYMGKEITEFIEKKLLETGRKEDVYFLNIMDLYDKNKRQLTMNRIETALIVINAPIVDAYTLSRMFKVVKNPHNQPDRPQNIIYYAGNAHSTTVREFLTEQGFIENAFVGNINKNQNFILPKYLGCIDVGNFPMPFFPNPVTYNLNNLPIKKPVVTGLAKGLKCDMSPKRCASSSTYRKSDIQKLAKKCGVPTNGTREQLCNLLKEKFNLKDTE